MSKSVAQYIVDGLKLELNPKLEQHTETDLDTVCAITGERITQGIFWKHVIPSSTGEYLGLMSGMAFPYLGIPAAMAFKGSWNMGSRLIFEDGTMYHPYISTASAEKSERTCWRDLVRDVWPARQGQSCLCIITDDYKKKIWPMARTGELGMNTPVLLLDSDRLPPSKNIASPRRLVSRLALHRLTINWEKLIAVLDFVETVRAAGFGRQAISESLFTFYAALMENQSTVSSWEARLVELRETPEFAVALLIAQKDVAEQGKREKQLSFL